ncbi:MAG: DEAD/DEAH box helicase family protein [Patescibacteria group bacterium]|nr:DEAD/DEAH box helicase family protein [Patescibacteria group bacterium]
MSNEKQTQAPLVKESDVRIVINRKLQESGWLLEGNNRNVFTEDRTEKGFADYVLLDRNGHNLAIVEAKNDNIDPYSAKAQAKGYADAKKCRYIFLANSEQIFFWDLKEGDATPIERFISPDDLQRRHDLKQSRKPLLQIEHNTSIADRPFSIKASQEVAKQFDEGKRAFLIEMATGTGKTRMAAALIERFLRAHQAERVLFIVDRIELAKQTLDEFQMQLGEEFGVARYRPNRVDRGATIMVATIQSLNLHFKEDFTPGYFDLVFNDECHRSIYGKLPRQVVEYFQAVRVGLTATPRDLMKNVDFDKLSDTDPRKMELRYLRDTYLHFGCEPGTPTVRYTIQDGVKDEILVPGEILRCLSIITKESYSEDGWTVEIDGEEYTYKLSQLEKKVLIPERNKMMCQQFLENALKSPDGSIGKSIIFAVSQNHALVIEKILNELNSEHNGKFAATITSRVKDASDLAKQFRKSDNYYPRVAVSVDMLSTGYDCPECLNIVLARPIMSPIAYIQIKGRGTRMYKFEDGTKKDKFLIHDFCEVVKYFEEEYDYDAPEPVNVGGGATPPEPPQPPKEIKVYKGKDELLFSEFIEVGPDGERVERIHYIGKWQKVLKELLENKPEYEKQLKDNILSEELEEEIKVNVFDKPKEYFNEHNLARAYKTMADLLDYVKAGLGMEKLPTQEEQLVELIDTVRTENDLNLEQTRLLKLLVQQLSASPEYIKQFEEGTYQFLDKAPFSSYGGSGGFLHFFGDKIKTVFETIKSSSVIRLSK